jgi:uncharacterized membrane protein
MKGGEGLTLMAFWCAVKKMSGRVKHMATAAETVERVVKERDTELFEIALGGEPAFREA